MSKKQIQSEETKKKFAEAAKALFAQKGYKGTSVEDIVKLAGGSKGNVYYHFTNKEGLFIYLLKEWEREFNEQWESKVEQYATIEETLTALAEHLLHSDLNFPLTKAADEFLNEEWNNSEVKDGIEAYIAGHIESGRKMFEKYMAKGELAQGDPHMLAVILEALFEGLDEMSRYSSGEPRQLYYKAVHVLLNGIKVR
ncbi:TetR/AcrR family transcriptional regulator [Saccharibacillus kuerlensis]|uniref:TetR family transcriptional regulator n=1 Tax=Saccharibacillus kuerlensis TaxID=459527 RepID=A0ABQ2L5W4_9BACL|nr:TetR/AcrR family transcriptional regulator [Saccharibacillus kuerlensis]GGO04623.1 TetR family transcriptional regulator [Saccharibacillus kuerlensis]